MEPAAARKGYMANPIDIIKNLDVICCCYSQDERCQSISRQ